MSNINLESYWNTQNTKTAIKKSLFAGTFAASLLAAIAATITFGLKLPVFVILGGPIALIAMAAAVGLIVGAVITLTVIALKNKKFLVKSTKIKTDKAKKENEENNSVNNDTESEKNVLAQLFTLDKHRNPLAVVMSNLPIESLLALRKTSKYSNMAVDVFIKQKVKEEIPKVLESLGETPDIKEILLLYKELECFKYFAKLSDSDSDKILKTHCLAYLLYKHNKAKTIKMRMLEFLGLRDYKPRYIDFFTNNGADLVSAQKLLLNLKGQRDLDFYLENTYDWSSLFLLKTILLLGADFGYALRREAEAGHTERVKLLLVADKQTKAVNAKDEYGQTALMIAAAQRHTDTVKALLTHKDILVNDKDEDGWTALMNATSRGHTDTVKALLAHKDILVNDKSNNGETALMWAAVKGHTYTVKALLARKDILVNAKDKYGWTALMFAARNGHTDTVKALLSHKDILVNDKNNDGWTALMYAAREGHTDIVKELIAHKDIDVNAKNNYGWTALMLAAKCGRTETTQALLAHNNIDLDTKNSDGDTALSIAKNRGHKEIVEILQSYLKAKTNSDKNSVNLSGPIAGITNLYNSKNHNSTATDNAQTATVDGAERNQNSNIV